MKKKVERDIILSHVFSSFSNNLAARQFFAEIIIEIDHVIFIQCKS